MINLDFIVQKQIWRSKVMDYYITGLLTMAIERHRSAVPWFNNDEVPEEYQPLDGSTAGAGIKAMLMAKIIQPWRGSIPESGIYGGIRRSSRKECNGHRNQLYVLTNEGIARAWLERHGCTVQPHQQDLFSQPCRSAVSAGL